MSNLFQNPDGANGQAQAVLGLIRRLVDGGIDESWCSETKRHRADPQLYRWHNCREQGYVIHMRGELTPRHARTGQFPSTRAINIAFYEHRNTDGIEVLCWEGSCGASGNPPTINDLMRGGDDKYRDAQNNGTSACFGEVEPIATWIVSRLTDFWVETAAEAQSIKDDNRAFEAEQANQG